MSCKPTRGKGFGSVSMSYNSDVSRFDNLDAITHEMRLVSF